VKAMTQFEDHMASITEIKGNVQKLQETLNSTMADKQHMQDSLKTFR
jgi:hypothetical protein